MLFHFPVRKRNQKHADIARIWAVANTQHQYTEPCAITTRVVGITITGQASKKVSAVTKRVSPAPRSAKAKVRLALSATE